VKNIYFAGRWDRRQSGRALTVNSGSYLQARFSGPTLDALFDLTWNQAPLPTIAWRIDEGEWQEAEIAAKVPLGRELAHGPHTVWFMVRGIDEHQNRWTSPLVGSVTFTGFELASQEDLLPPVADWLEPRLKIEFLGDSITEGVLVQEERPGKTTWAWRTNALRSWPCQTALLLGAAWRQVGFGATGLVRAGSGGAPGALETLNFFHASCPRDDWQPDLVIVNQGSNDRGVPAAQYAPLYRKYLSLIRQAYPGTKIVALLPFIGDHRESISREVESARAAGDLRIYYIDSTGWYTEAEIHPPASASPRIASKLVAALRSQALV
jgi:lysophospholipase L1-like esterase